MKLILGQIQNFNIFDPLVCILQDCLAFCYFLLVLIIDQSFKFHKFIVDGSQVGKVNFFFEIIDFRQFRKLFDEVVLFLIFFIVFNINKNVYFIFRTSFHKVKLILLRVYFFMGLNLILIIKKIILFRLLKYDIELISSFILRCFFLLNVTLLY